MLLVSILLVLFQIHLAHAQDCELSISWQYETRIKYETSCVEASNRYDFARCLLQRNTLNNVLSCAEFGARKHWMLPVASGSRADAMDLMPGSLEASADDLASLDDGREHSSDFSGVSAITPKGILMWASHRSVCPAAGTGPEISYGNTYRNIYIAFDRCPFVTMGQFKNCLCCNFVTPDDMEAFESDCIWNPRFSPWAERPVFPVFSWSCSAVCEADYTRPALVKDSEEADSKDTGNDLGYRDQLDISTFSVIDGTPVTTATISFETYKYSVPTTTTTTSNFIDRYPHNPEGSGASHVDTVDTS